MPPDASDNFPETADIETASEGYAARFSSAAGQWMLHCQTRALLAALDGLPPPATVLDVGGGHAQTAPPLRERGYTLTVTGSDETCRNRLPGDLPFVRANHLALPWADRSFEAVLSFRLLPHCERWPELVGELCRVAERRVVVDYPARCSVNMLADALFAAKKRFEKNTRPFTLFQHREIRQAFAQHGFVVKKTFPQFALPMVLHRMLNRPALSRALEAPCRWLGLTRLLGSPVVLLAERKPDR